MGLVQSQPRCPATITVVVPRLFYTRLHVHLSFLIKRGCTTKSVSQSVSLQQQEPYGTVTLRVRRNGESSLGSNPASTSVVSSMEGIPGEA